jgi:hypothetical protein
MAVWEVVPAVGVDSVCVVGAVSGIVVGAVLLAAGADSSDVMFGRRLSYDLAFARFY